MSAPASGRPAELTDLEVEALLDACGLRLPAALRTLPKGAKPCGTEAAYKRHLRHGEEPCPQDKAAAAQAKADATARRLAGIAAGTRTVQHRKPIDHGTPEGYEKHRYAGEIPCDRCAEAERLRSSVARNVRDRSNRTNLSKGNRAA